MTTALPIPTHTPTRRSAAPRLRVVGERRTGAPGASGERIGYLVFLPEDADPVALLSAHGVRPEVHPIATRTSPAASEPKTAADSTADPAPERTGREPARDPDVIRVDPTRRVIEVDGRELELTYLEFGLLAHLVTNPHRVHTRESLIAGIWGYGHIGDGRTVDVHIARLRRKLGPSHRDRIVTVRRVGYKYVPAHR